MSQVPAGRLVAPAVVLDFSAQAAADPDFLLEVEHIRDWERAHGPLPDGGWLLYRTGWDERSDSQERFLNAEESPVIGIGTETVGTDAGAAHSFDPPFPCHAAMLGAGKYGLTQLQNLASLPATGVVLIVTPLPITGGSGSPCRALALVDRS